jgi:putative transposase
MMAKDVRKVSREGVRLFGHRYYAPELYSRTHGVQVRYDINDLSSILVYSADGKYLICEAQRMDAIHPAANILGDDQDREALQTALRLKKDQERDASSIARGVLEDAMADQRRRMRELAPTPDKDKALDNDPTLPKAKLKSITQAKAHAREAKADAPAYTPPAQCQDITTELEKYEYLFGVKYRQGLPLREADREWMEQYEATDEFQEIAANRYERLRRFYERKVAQA